MSSGVSPWFLEVKILRVLLLLPLLLVFVGCGGAREDTEGRTVVRIAYLPITHSAAVMLLPDVSVADENFRVELVRFTSWPEVVEALRARRVDGASLLLEVAFRAFEMDPTLTAVSLSHRDGNVLVVDNHVDDFSGLIGQTVAIPHALSPHMTFLRLVLEREGIDIDDINLIEISPAEMPFTMAAGAISAYVVAEPWGSLAEVRGVGRILETSNDILPGSICCLFVFNSGLFDEHEGLFEWLLEHFSVAAEYAGASDEKVFDAFRRYTSFDQAIIEQSLVHTTFSDLVFSLEDFESATSNILRFGIMEEVPDFFEFVACRGCGDE